MNLLELFAVAVLAGTVLGFVLVYLATAHQRGHQHGTTRPDPKEPR